MIKRMLLSAVLLSASFLLCSCALKHFYQGKEKCELTVTDRVIVTCGEKEYVIISEELAAHDIGNWIGTINKNISGVMFATVYADKKNTDMIDISINDTFYRAVLIDSLSDEMALFHIDAISGVETDIKLNEENAMELLYNGDIYRITERIVDTKYKGEYIGCIARSIVCDADTGRILPKEEYLSIDWGGGREQNRRAMTYENVCKIKDSFDEIGIEIDGVYYVAEKSIER